jgi:SAM-dependent methyltransferase
MTAVDFPPETFDVVVAFHSIIHVPRTEQPLLVRRIHRWLRPAGVFLATWTVQAWEGVEKNWEGSRADVVESSRQREQPAHASGRWLPYRVGRRAHERRGDVAVGDRAHMRQVAAEFAVEYGFVAMDGRQPTSLWDMQAMTVITT